MAITATLELRFKPELVDEARTLFRGVLKDTRAFDGNLGVEVLVDTDDPAHWIAYETWESPEHDAAYREFRAGPGKITEMGALLAAAPVLTWFTVDDDI
jgi:quinol monooxygenase YgiN